MPTKNRGYCIWKSIISIQEQTYKDWELIIVDGESTDNTLDVVHEFSDDSRIKVVTNKNDTGVASARNRGIKESLGDYIGYLDSDDTVLPSWLEEIEKHLISNSIQLIMPNKHFVMKLVDENNKTTKIFIDKPLYDSPPTINTITNLEVPSDTNGMVHSKSIITSAGQWNEKLKLYEDYEFLVRILDKFPNSLKFVNRILVEYTRTYGKDGLCGKAQYKDLVDSLNAVYKLHNKKDILKDITWYPSTIEKYTRYQKEEENNGRTILDHLLEKYSDE